MNRWRLGSLIVLVLLCFAAVLEPAGEAAAPIEIKEVTYAHGLTDDDEPIDPEPDARFTPDQTIYLSVVFKKPQSMEGDISGRLYQYDTLVVETSGALEDLDNKLLLALGADIYFGFSFSHTDPWPVGNNYRTEVSYEDELLGVYPLNVVPPADAMPSRVDSVTLARGADADYNPIDPTNAFESDEYVYVVGAGDFGTATWVQAQWEVGGQLDGEATRVFTMNENSPAMGFTFSNLPDGGWTTGVHTVTLTMNDELVGAYPFTMEEPFFNEVVFFESMATPDNTEFVDVAEDYDSGFLTSMTGPELFDAYSEWFADEGWREQAPTGAATTLPNRVWTTEGAELLLEVQGQDDRGWTEIWVKLTKTAY